MDYPYISGPDKEALLADMAVEAEAPLEPKFVVPDAVNHPAHYCNGSIECIDAIESAIQPLDGPAAFLAGTSIKYVWRHALKGKPIEDIDKAIWYLTRLKKYYQERVA